ncbi:MULTISPECIES: hypothetical protein [Acinetobacter calcoaceticus/baumannii complex]|uniref:hypothetical protein n=1 Tax=Acinetobacter calcoaceticus/baumannii complex TaxID=909768 RepID=UPI00102F0DAE|nr:MULTISPECIES: hypothetical protein [Acinetobacter calcoaceticus/baumannii complex]MDH2551898.1 hypothetical protein [Acinetobacter baumannii]RZG97518.1 hypothetical protein EXE03_08395 [Acinetobacter pittii]
MDFLADDELTLNQEDPRFKPKSERGGFSDGALGVVSGVAMGTIEAATAPDALIRGDKKAAALRAQNLEIFKPDDLGGVGEFTYGLTKDFTRIGWNAVTTLGTGGVPGLALNSGLFGYQTFEAEKSDLLNKGADIKTARTGGAIKGITDALGFAIPTHGVAKSVVADAVATTTLATGAGVAGDYLEGSFLENNENKKVAQYGEVLKENALSPSTLAANGGMALLLNLWANKGRLRPEQVKEHGNVDTMNDAAHVQANLEHAEGMNPFNPENAKEANSHFDALDSAMESALNDELVSLRAPVSGTPKAIVTSTPVVPITGTPKAIVRPSAINTDEHKAPVIAELLTNPVFDKKPWTKTIVQEASKRGINPVDALVISHLETGGTFDPKIQPPIDKKTGKPISSATGLFQTLDGTFARMGGKNKFDGNDQIKAGLNYYEHNAKVFRSHFNRDPNGLELYYLHFFGEGGGPVFLKAKDNELFVDVATRWSKGNQKKTARQIAEGITSSHQFNGMTVGQVKAKYEKRWNEIASLYSDVSSDASVRSTEVRGSESEFPQFESDITAPPAYKSQSDAEVEAMPFVLSADEHNVKSLQEEFEALSSPLTKEDLEYLKATAHYQYSEGGAYRTPYVEPQVDLSGPSNSASRNLDTLDSDLYQLEPEQQRVMVADPQSNALDIDTKTPDSNPWQDSITAGLDNWIPTRSQNYLKRERSMDDGGVIQELHNKTSNTTFQRQINQDGTISPVKATRNGNDLFAHPANSKADSPELTAVQHKATQALEREFWKPGKSKVDGAPDLTKSSKGEYGAFTDTADGREAVSILEADPDMEVTFTRLDENGDEEIVTMSSRDLLDYVKEQEEIAKDEIQAVKALASCALRFGSEAA